MKSILRCSIPTTFHLIACVYDPLSAYLKTLLWNATWWVIFRTLTTLRSMAHKPHLPRTACHFVVGTVTRISLSLCTSCGFISDACVVRMLSPENESHLAGPGEGTRSFAHSWMSSSPEKQPEFLSETHTDPQSVTKLAANAFWHDWSPLHWRELCPNETDSYDLLDIQWGWDHQKYLSHSALIIFDLAC